MSNLKYEFTGETYAEADEFLGAKASRKVCYATKMNRGSDGDIRIRHHETDIITYRKDGTIILNTDGWVSITTTQRLHEFTPEWVRVNYRKGRYLITLNDEESGTMWDGDADFTLTTN